MVGRDERRRWLARRARTDEVRRAVGPLMSRWRVLAGCASTLLRKAALETFDAFVVLLFFHYELGHCRLCVERGRCSLIGALGVRSNMCHVGSAGLWEVLTPNRFLIRGPDIVPR